MKIEFQKWGNSLALRIPSADFPVPWVNFTYHWNW